KANDKDEDEAEGRTTMNFELMEALQVLEREKGISTETLLHALADALASAYKRLRDAAEEAEVTIDPDTGEIHVYAQELDEDGNVTREWEDSREDFGRIAAQTAKQVILQRIREAERAMKYEEYAGREGDIVTGISDGVVELKSVAREPGHRTKIAVWSNDANVDPVGACVGARGARVRMVVNELRGEKVDIVPYSEEPSEFVAKALSPAKVKEVRIHEDSGTAEVIVPDFQLSLAIGKEGQNARLAARLTGWRVDIKSEAQLAEEEANFAAQEWAEGEWVEDASGTLVWQPAEGGDAVTVEQWSHGDTGEVPVIKDEEPEVKEEEPAAATTIAPTNGEPATGEPATSDSGAEA